MKVLVAAEWSKSCQRISLKVISNGPSAESRRVVEEGEEHEIYLR